MSEEKPQQKKVVLITGCSSGIGFETALALARQGYFTYATMRDTNKGSELIKIGNDEKLQLEILQLDVTNQDSINKAMSTILEKNNVDVLINNAGTSLLGSCEDISIEEYKNEFETNFFGPIRMIKAVISKMREQKSGRIINVSSILGMTGMSLLSGYACTKFSLEGLTQSLRQELKDYGIKCSCIEPGTVNTNLHQNMKTASKSNDSIYKEITQKTMQNYLNTK